MSPEQIEAVRRTWSSALTDREVLVSAIAAQLGGDEEAGVERVRWAADSVTRLLLVLDRPAALRSDETGEPCRLPALTVPDVDRLQAAVLQALRIHADPPGALDEQAWHLAFDLFRELVAAPHLDPFGAGHTATTMPPIPTTTTTTTTPPTRRNPG